MGILEMEPQSVFKYFEELSAVPRGSGHRVKIADYCENFAKKNGLEFYRDDANNVVIYKGASKGYENAEPMILQGHLDMVWQKAEDSNIDLENEGLSLYTDGEYIGARGTTLGADNGIAVAMIMAILEDDTLSHPPIEAVFTSDEEIGMLGAKELDVSVLKSKRMINIDSEEPGVITVSCAGGSDFRMTLPAKREKAFGCKVDISLKGLKGGHSGIEIDSGRVNANILSGRILAHLAKMFEFDIVSVSGGSRANAITNLSKIELVCKDSEGLVNEAELYIEAIKEEISAKEEGFFAEIDVSAEAEYEVFSKEAGEKVIYALALCPNGVQEMSAEIDNLVETSLNLGILVTDEKGVSFTFALRSSKKTALFALGEKLETFSRCIGAETESSGYYPPWEFKKDSYMQKLCSDVYEKMMGKKPKIEAIHAGLECAVFSGSIPGLDCISVGPKVLDAHTIDERLMISSVGEVYEMVLNIMKECR